VFLYIVPLKQGLKQKYPAYNETNNSCFYT